MPQCLQSKSLNNNAWFLADPKISDIQALQRYTDTSEIIARLMCARNISVNKATTYLQPRLKETLPDPFHLKDMDKAVERTYEAICQREKILVFGDYDVDGATSGALLIRFFHALNVPIESYIPDREKEGYGPSVHAFQKFIDAHVNLIITVDCGGNAFTPLAYAAENNLDVIVLDHHMGENKTPPACAVVNPNRADETSEYTYLAAVGVTFLFLIALNQKLRTSGWYRENNCTPPNLIESLDLVALGTVCDVMPLIGLNRAFVSQGLKILNTTKNIGLQALKNNAGLTETISTYHLGFVLGPRINAGGRLGASALGTKLLSTQEVSTTESIATELGILNKDRQTLEKDILLEALEKAPHCFIGNGICIMGDDWPQGVIGLIASRIKEKYHKPTFVITFKDGIGKGSGRSISGFDMGDFIHKAKDQGILKAGGGHKMAAGLSMSADQLDAFNAYFATATKALDIQRKLHIDTLITPKAATIDLLTDLEKLEPFGMGNHRPRFLISQARISFAKVVGEKHIQCTLQDETGESMKSIAFNVMDTPMGEALLSGRKDLCHFIGTIHKNVWQGSVSVQFQIEDMAETLDEV